MEAVQRKGRKVDGRGGRRRREGRIMPLREVDSDVQIIVTL